jgi:polysaccharide biosynthesis protein PslH
MDGKVDQPGGACGTSASAARRHPPHPAWMRGVRILFHNCRLLHPLHGGDRIRTFNMLRELRKRHHITYVTLRTPADAAAAAARATEYCHELIAVPHAVKNQRTVRFFAEVLGNTLFGKYPFLGQKYVSPEATRRIAELAPGHDLLICDYLAPMVNLLELPARPPVPTLLFQHNVESMIFERHAATAANPLKRALYRRQWRMMLRFERQSADFVDAQVAVSDEDVQTFRDKLGMRNVLGAVPTGVDCDLFQPAAPAAQPVLAFLGSMDWDANQDAVTWFAKEILPRIRASVPGAELLAIGRNPPATLRGLPGVRLTGTVPDVRPHMAGAAAMVLPLRIGGGTRIKIYEAMAMGVPVVSTRIGAEGLDVSHGKNILLADDAAQFAGECLALLEDRARAATLAAEARRHVAENYSWSRVSELFSGYCERVVAKL